MQRELMLCAMVGALTVQGGTATAGIYTDDLSRCLVRHATESDKATLVKWMFSAMSVNPAVAGMITLTPKQREGFTRDGAILMQRLLLDDCRPETVEALRYERSTAIEGSFQVLGQVAGSSLMSNSAVNAELAKLGDYIDKDRWAILERDTGGASPEAAKPK